MNGTGLVYGRNTVMVPDQRDLDFLSEHKLPYVCVDMPQGQRDSVPPVLAVTDPGMAVVRPHGRSDKWDSTDIDQRFGYRYTDGELAAWAQYRRPGAG